jgi:hypothetical protein
MCLKYLTVDKFLIILLIGILSITAEPASFTTEMSALGYRVTALDRIDRVSSVKFNKDLTIVG